MRKSKEIVLIKDDEVLHFINVKECAKALGITCMGVYNVLCGNTRTVCGYEAHYLDEFKNIKKED